MRIPFRSATSLKVKKLVSWYYFCRLKLKHSDLGNLYANSQLPLGYAVFYRLTSRSRSSVRRNRDPYFPEKLDNIGYIMEMWPCDDLVKTSPIYLVSDQLSKAFAMNEFTGYTLKPCELQEDDQLMELHPNRPALTVYHWITFQGIPKHDDFGIQDVIDL